MIIDVTPQTHYSGVMLFDDDLPSFGSICGQMESLKIHPFGHMEGHLEWLQGQIRIIRLAKDTGMDKRDELKILVVQFSAQAYAEKVWELIHQELPLVDTEEEFRPDLMGLNNLTWDDADEILENPSGGYNESLLVFLVFCLTGENAEQEQWDEARAAFGWPEFEPIVLDPDNYDEDAAMQYLIDHQADDLQGALEIGFFSPDNVFFSQNPEDGSWEGLEINAENLDYLKDEWEEAEPVCKRYGIALRALDKDPERYTVLIAAMEAGHMISHDEVQGEGKDDENA